MFPNFNREENSIQQHLGEENVPLLLPNPGRKSFDKKSLKKLSSFPLCKRPRTDQPNEIVMTDGPNDHDAKSYDHVRCLSDEKCRIVKQKHGQDSRRIDKRCIKASEKTKFDPCTSKASLIISDSAYGWIDKIAGVHGLKTDLHDVTKHVEELSLDELLDGSYKYSNLRADKGKKTSCGNENFLHSVRKACTILPLHGAPNSGGNKTSLPNTSSLHRDEKDKCCEESSNKDSSLARLNTSTLYQPKDILGHLALATIDLEDFMLNSNPSQGATNGKAIYTTGLPAFSWSFSHGGPCKSGVDSCKFTLPRSAGQIKWVRIGNMSTSNGDNNNCFSSLEMKTLGQIGDFANRRKIDELLRDIGLLTESIMPSFERSQHNLESSVLDHNALIQCSDAYASLNSGRLGVLDGCGDASDNNLKDDSEYHLYRQKFEPDVCLTGLSNKLHLADSQNFDSPLMDGEVGQKVQLINRRNHCFQSLYNYPSKRSTGGCGQSLLHSPTPEIYEPGHSSQLFAAATILCEMASCSNAVTARDVPSLRIKWPRPRKSIKHHKSTSSLEKAKRLLLSSRQQDTFKTNKTLSRHTNNMVREPVKWSLPPTKVYDNQQTVYGGSCIKDWSRGKMKRV